MRNKHVMELLDINIFSGMEIIKHPDVKIIITDRKCSGDYTLKKRMDYIILLKNNDPKTLKRYFYDNGNFFLSFNTFQKYFTAITNRYDSMINDTAIYKKDLSAYVFGFDANKYNSFRDYNDDVNDNDDMREESDK